MKWYYLLPVALVITLPSLFPMMRQDFFHLHDFTHVARLSEMDRALQDGHFPVRWSRNLGYGYGMPQFNFYAPLPYYISWFITLTGVSYLTAIKLMVGLNFLVSFYAMYYVFDRFSFPIAGILAGAAFVWAPYRAVDTYVRGAFGELTAITFIALCLLAIVYWSKHAQSLKYMAGISLSVAGLLTSHNLVAFLSLPLLFIFGLILPTSKKSFVKKALRLSASMLLGVGLGAFYAVPAFLEKSFTRVDEITTGFSDYRQHFLYIRQFFQPNWGYGGSIFGPDDDISFYLSILLLILGSLGCVLFLLSKTIDHHLRRMALLSVSIFFVSLLMSTFKMQWFWNLIPLMKYVQFPWRYLSISIVFLSVLVGGVGVWLQKNHQIRGSVIQTSIVVVAIMLTNFSFFKPEEYLADTSALYYSDPQKISTHMSEIIPDFLPIDADESIEPSAGRFTQDTQDDDLTILVDNVHEFVVEIASTAPFTFKPNIFWYPGWTLYSGESALDIDVDKDTGLMSAAIDTQGVVRISGIFEETPLRKMSNLVSVLSLVIVLYWMQLGKLTTKRSKK